MSKMIKIMVTAIGGRAAYNLVRCLKESPLGKNLSFVGADMSNGHPRLLCDEFVTLPSPKSKEYIPAMQNIVTELGVNLVIPTSDEECLALAKNRGRLENRNRNRNRNINTLPIGSYEGVMSVKDKLEMYNATKHLGIVPVTAEIKKGSNVREIKKLVGLPAFIKPRMGRGGRHTHVVRDDSGNEQKKLDAYWGSFAGDFGAPICQRFMDSSDYGIDAYINSSGKVFFGAARKKLAVASGDKVIGMRSVSIDAPEMESVFRKIIETFGLRGLNEAEMRKDSSGKFYAIDVNPRAGGSIYLSNASGRNIAILPVLDYLGEQYPAFEYKTGVEMERREIEAEIEIETETETGAETEHGRIKYFWDFVNVNNFNPGAAAEAGISGVD